MSETIKVSLSFADTVRLVDDVIVKGSFTGERIDDYTVDGAENTHLIVLVYEKYYMRVNNRLTLTVTIDDFEGVTRVHYVGGGGGAGLLRFDYGAADGFSKQVTEIFSQYLVK